MRPFSILLFLVCASFAAFNGVSPVKKVTATDSPSVRIPLPVGTQVSITVRGHAAFVTIGDTGARASIHDTATRANQNIYLPVGVTIRNRPTVSSYVAAVSADSAQTTIVQFEVGTGAP